MQKNININCDLFINKNDKLEAIVLFRVSVNGLYGFLFFQNEILKEIPGKKWEKSKKFITFVVIKIKVMGIDGLMGI